jgi:hypothetical protein
MSRLELFLRDLKLTPKQAKSPFSPNTYRRRKSSINSLRRKKKTKPDTLGKIKKVIQEKRQEERQAQQLVNNEIAADREEANQLLLNNDPERIAQVNQLLDNPITLQDAKEVIQIEKRAEDKITRQARAQKRLQADEQEDINEMDIGQQTPQTINGEEVTTQVEIDLGCNEVEDQDEDDENQDNEICNIPLPFIPQQQDDGIDTLLSRQIRRIGSRRAQRTTQFQTIQSRIFDIVHESYSEGKLQAEVKNTSFKGNNQNGVITIYKTDNNLIKRIKNTFNEYVYTDDSPITLNDTDILSFLVYGVEKTIKGETKRYKVEKPKPKLKRVVVGGDNTDKIDKTIGCYTDGTRPGCSFFNDLTTLYGYFNTAVNKDDLIKSVILWFDTHHDFKAGKEGRYPKAENVWNAAFGRETFITWYAKKFFTPDPLNPNQLYSFSNEAEDRDNTNVLTPVVDFNNRGTAIPTLLYNISQTYLQNRLFEKTVLLHYIVHNFAVTPPGVLPVNYSTTLLRDILYVHRQTYNNLLEGIEKQVREINGGNNDPQKLKMLKGVVLKLKPLIKLYGDQFNLLALTNALTNARTNALTNALTNARTNALTNALTNAINYINLGNINNVLDVLNNNNALNGINNINDINAIIYILLNYVPAFTFVDINNPFPSFTSSNNTSYVVDVNKSNDLLGNNLQYVPAALFDSNGGNTYDPGNNTDNTAYDTFIGLFSRQIIPPNTPPQRGDYATDTGVNHLGNKYKYRRNGCNLEVTQNNPLNNQVNNVLTKADIRCGSQVAIRDNFTIPDDAKNILHVKGYLTQKLRPVVPDDEFIVRMYKVLEKFVRDGNRFAIQKNGNTYSLTLPKYFNNIRSGPGVQDLVFLTILYRLEGRGDLPLQLIDNIVNLKRVGDYGQVIDAKMDNLPFFTTDNMETLMCIIEKVSCYIDFNQGVIIYDNNGGGDDGGFIRSKTKSGNAFALPQVPPGYPRRT